MRLVKLFSMPFFLLLLQIGTISAQYNPNTDTYCSTVNFKDGGKTYEYTAAYGSVFLRIAGGQWTNLNAPCGKISNISADNNRLLVLTEDKQFYWYCPKLDTAQWVITALTIATSHDDNPLANKVRSAVASQMKLTSFQDYRSWVENAHKTGTWNKVENLDKSRRTEPWSSNGERIIDIAVGNWYGTVSTFYVLTRNTGSGGHIYWIDEEPIMSSWEELTKKTDRVAESLAWGVAWDALSKASYPPPLAGPFATTALAYSQNALVNANYYYDIWGRIQFVPPTQKFTTQDCVFGNSPNSAITDDSRINASNSVLCVSTKTSSNVVFKYIRFDYHHQPNFLYWPAVDWAETAWHSYSTPLSTDMKNYNFSTHNPSANPANNVGPWRKPPFAGSVELFVVPLIGPVSVGYSFDWGGFFGTGVYQWDINYYPTRFFTRTNNETVTIYNSYPTSVSKKYKELNLAASLATCLLGCFPIFQDAYGPEKFAVNDGPPIAGIFQAERVNAVSWSTATQTYQDLASSRKFPSFEPKAGVWYKILNRWNISECLDADLAKGPVTSGSNVQTWIYSNAANQQWQFISNGNGTYRIMNRANSTVGLDADIAPGALGNGTNVHCWTYTGGTNQQWKLLFDGNGYCAFLSAMNSSYTVDGDLTGGSVHDGSNVHMWTLATGYSFNGSTNQQWQLVAVP